MARLFLTCLLFLFATSPARAMKFAVFGVGNATLERDNAPPPLSPSPALEMGTSPQPGSGALVAFAFSPRSDLEIGVTYFTSAFTATQTCQSPNPCSVNSAIVSKYEIVETKSWKTFEVPVIWRYWLFDSLNFGIGAYFQKFIPDVKVGRKTTVNSSDPTYSYSMATFSQLNAQPMNLGVLASVGINIGLGPSSSVLVEGRYNKGLLNNTVDSARGFAVKFDNIQALVGVRIWVN